MPSLKTLRHQDVLFTRLVEELTQVRIDQPERALVVAQKRLRRTKLALDGRLALLEADHPARGIVSVGDQRLAMADRQDFLIRIVRILSASAADGVVATMDVIEELLLLHDLMQSRGLEPFLDEKVLIVSLNRGGLAGSTWEMDDPRTGPTPEQCAQLKMDGVKMLWRYCDSDKGSLKTLRCCAQAISEANSVKLPFFLEPLPMITNEAGTKLEQKAEALVPLVGAASALGDSSRYLWFLLPYCVDFGLVAGSTTLPILVLGSDSQGGANYLDNIKDGLASAHNVRGTMTGRNVLYAPEQDPVDAAAIVHELVHHGTSAEIQ